MAQKDSKHCHFKILKKILMLLDEGCLDNMHNVFNPPQNREAMFGNLLNEPTCGRTTPEEEFKASNLEELFQELEARYTICRNSFRILKQLRI